MPAGTACPSPGPVAAAPTCTRAAPQVPGKAGAGKGQPGHCVLDLQARVFLRPGRAAVMPDARAGGRWEPADPEPASPAFRHLTARCSARGGAVDVLMRRGGSGL